MYVCMYVCLYVCLYVAESIRRLIELGNQLTKGLTNVMDHQSYMRQREDLHANSAWMGLVPCI